MFGFLKRWFGGTAETVRKGFFGGGLRGALSQGKPGGWADDHREQTDHYKGWTYAAVSAVSDQAAQATVNVWDESDDEGIAYDGPEDYGTQIPSGPSSTFFSGSGKPFARGHRKSHNQDDADNRKPVPKNDPLRKLMRRPNPHQSGSSFLKEVSTQLRLTGTALIYKVYNGLGQVCELYVVPTAVAMPIPPTQEYPNGSFRIQPVTHYYNADDSGFASLRSYGSVMGAMVDAADMIIIREPHPLWKDEGYSPVAASALQTDVADQLDRSRWAHLKNGIDPSVIVTLPADIDATPEELERAEAKLNAKFSGTQNVGKAAVMNAGATITPWSATAQEMAYSESYPQARDSVLAVHRVPGVAAGITDGGSYAAFYASLKQFVTLCIAPHLRMIGDELTHQLAHPYFGEHLTIELVAVPIDDPDLLERRLATDNNAKAITINEQRELRGMEPVEWGNVQVGTVVTGPQANPAPEPDTSPVLDLLNPKPSDERSTGLPVKPPRLVPIGSDDANANGTNGKHYGPRPALRRALCETWNAGTAEEIAGALAVAMKNYP